MAGTFEIYKDKAGEFRFRLKATNGQVVATGEGYKTKASAIEDIESVQKHRQGQRSKTSVRCRPRRECFRKGPASSPVLALPIWQQDKAWRARCMISALQWRGRFWRAIDQTLRRRCLNDTVGATGAGHSKK